MFGGTAHKIGILAKKAAGGGGGDVTPNSIAWETSLEDVNPATSHASITGIDTPINIYFECTYCGDGGVIQYSKNSGTYITLDANTNISVSNGNTISWKYTVDPWSSGYVAIITVRNASDSNALLKEITFVQG
jgi:hypothetical protein